MFLQDAPPDTSGYMIAGYVVFFLVSAIYLFSLFVRSRNLKQDLNALESMKEEAPVKTEMTPPKPKRKAAAGKSKSRQAGKKTAKKK